MTPPHFLRLALIQTAIADLFLDTDLSEECEIVIQRGMAIQPSLYHTRLNTYVNIPTRCSTLNHCNDL